MKKSMHTACMGHEHRARCALLFCADQNHDPELQQHQQTLCREALQATWCAFSEQLPHHQQQVESAHVNQHPQHLLQVLDELNGTS